jgi:plastocyanin
MNTATKVVSQNKTLLVIGLVIATLSFGGLYAFSSGKNATPVSAAGCPVEACISLLPDYADPNVLTVKNGSTVQINSADGKKHNLFLAHSGAQHDDHSEYNSGEFGADEAWKVQFKKDGAYSFKDKNNPNISISVVVYTPGKDYRLTN